MRVSISGRVSKFPVSAPGQHGPYVPNLQPNDFASSLRSLLPGFLVCCYWSWWLRIACGFCGIFFVFHCATFSSIISLPSFASTNISSFLTQSGRNWLTLPDCHPKTAIAEKKDASLRFSTNDPACGLEPPVYGRQSIGDEHPFVLPYFLV